MKLCLAVDGITKHEPDRDFEPGFEAAFRLSGNPHLRLEAAASHAQAAAFLEHAITRTRHDLRSHVQRIYLHLARQDGAAVFGALLDLFITLQERGRPLRRRMLSQAARVLKPQDYQFLFKRLETGLQESEALPPCRHSLLNRGLSSDHRLVYRHDSDQASVQDPLQQARDHLEYGQVDEARQVLEQAILKTPARLELHQDLLQIYHSLKTRDLFLAMYQRLDTQTNPAAAAWQALADRFGQEG